MEHRSDRGGAEATAGSATVGRLDNRCRRGTVGSASCQTESMSEAPKLKDYFDQELIVGIGRRIATVHDGFDEAAFHAAALTEDWEDLSLTQRSQAIADALWSTLSLPATEALGVLTAALPPELDSSDGVLNDGFELWPFGDLIATYAVDELDAGLEACRELTKRFTAEFAIRPFLRRYPEALERIAPWTEDDNEHIRRLVSEGSRPRLPWATRLDLPVEPVLELLGRLRTDPSLYVRRSVANHLNDLAKDHPDHIVSLLEAWHAEGVDETTWIVRHALRNHLKAGDPRVMTLFGYGEPEIDVVDLRVDPATVEIGEAASVSFDLTSTTDQPQDLHVDLVIGYMKANGKRSPKVFKYRTFELEGGQTESCAKKLSFVHRSTRKLYPGEHTLAVRVNGSDLATTGFELTD